MLHEFKVKESDDGIRADVFVTKYFPAFSRSALRNLFTRGFVSNKHVKLKAGEKLRAGDSLLVEDDLIKVIPRSIALPIIYQDENVVVINKPQGMLTHSKGALNLEPTVASFLSSKITDKALSGNRGGIVHRLDRQTSGVIICARNSMALKYLQKQFSGRNVEKIYLAIVEGKLDPPEALIDAPIARNSAKPQTFKVSSNGKQSQTEYYELKNFKKGNKAYSLIELKPLTGRTHQLRVHLAYIGHPIVGDNIYGHGDSNMLLHAKSLEIRLPGGILKNFRASLPKRFKDFTQK